VGLYFDGNPGAAGVQSFTVHADLHRDDLCAAIGSCNHGFTTAPPRSLLDGKSHTVNAYGVDSMGGNNAALSGGPKTFQCDPPAPPLDALHGVKRWIPSPTVFGAWRFDGFRDVAHEPDALVASFPDGPDLPDAPVVVQADDGTPEVWVIDTGVRRHVVDPTSLSAWRFDGAGVVVKQPAAQVYQYPKGVDFPAAPFVFVGPSDPKTYILDVPLQPPSAGTGGGGAGTGGASSASAASGAGGGHAVEEPTPRAKGGCRCEAGGDGSSDGRFLALVVAALLLLPRRRRATLPINRAQGMTVNGSSQVLPDASRTRTIHAMPRFSPE
jgi:MYXO-CTERM domain-containing protein